MRCLTNHCLLQDLQKPKSPKPPGSHQSSRSAQSSHELEGMLLLAFLDATEDHMMKSLKVCPTAKEELG